MLRNSLKERQSFDRKKKDTVLIYVEKSLIFQSWVGIWNHRKRRCFGNTILDCMVIENCLIVGCLTQKDYMVALKRVPTDERVKWPVMLYFNGSTHFFLKLGSLCLIFEANAMSSTTIITVTIYYLFLNIRNSSAEVCQKPHAFSSFWRVAPHICSVCSVTYTYMKRGHWNRVWWADRGRLLHTQYKSECATLHNCRHLIFCEY